MTDQEYDRALLQAAAREAGIDCHIEHDGEMIFRGYSNKGLTGKWNPLEDMDQAIQLAIKAGVSVQMANGTFIVSKGHFSSDGGLGDGGAALRRAIVKATYHYNRAFP